MNKLLYIVRGIPGSGKSTFAKTLGGVHFEADQYFHTGVNGEYEFKPEKIRDAHNYCQESVESAMKNGENVIVVSNTFTQEWEMKPYYDFSKMYNYKVFSIIIENRHDGKNEHGVPDDKLELMKNRFEIKL
jgi:predicted kinase